MLIFGASSGLRGVAGDAGTGGAVRPSGSAAIIAASLAARGLRNLRALPTLHCTPIRLDESPSHAVALASSGGELSAIVASVACPTVCTVSTSDRTKSRCAINAASVSGSWLTASAPTIAKKARRAKATLALRRNLREGHNKPNSG